jgi:hypothetical protein
VVKGFNIKTAQTNPWLKSFVAFFEIKLISPKKLGVANFLKLLLQQLRYGEGQPPFVGAWHRESVRMNMFRVKKLHLRAVSPMRFRFLQSTTMSSFSPLPDRLLARLASESFCCS